MQIAIRGIKRKYKCAVHQALLKMPRSNRRITGKGAESPKMTQSSGALRKSDSRAFYEA